MISIATSIRAAVAKPYRLKLRRPKSVKIAIRLRRSNGRKATLLPVRRPTTHARTPVPGAAAMVLATGGSKPAVVARVLGLGRRIIAELTGDAGVRRLCFARTRDGSYRLAGNRNPKASALYVF